ncbi:MAG TPA: ATP-binding protein [Bryobacteraceae bacterium]|nr:ATP-binding protein [Bryobacteraceae bacterium]
MNPLKRSPLYSSVFALFLTAAALFVSLLLRPYLAQDLSLPFLAAVWLSAWYHGLGGGLLATGSSAVCIVYFFLRPDWTSQPLSSAVTGIVAFVVIALGITGMTSRWRDNHRLLVATLSGIGDGVVVTDRAGRITFLNPAAESLTGWPAEEARGKAAGEVLRLVDQKSHETIESPLTRVLRESVVVSVHENQILVSRSGTELPIEQGAAPVRDAAGRLRGAILVFRDVSKRRQLEEQAAHTEKMDAVGRLAGGIAGDFNNVLTVISGYAELLRGETPVSSPLRRFADEIIYAGERAATLTRHLLAFSRGPGVQPRPLDLNAVITGMEPMLRRLLGQSVELILLPGSGVGRVQADPAQIEQVIVNLASNSRDAMPEGGKLVIETDNVEIEQAGSENLGVPPGSYVMLGVSDTGVGMSAETRSRLFEPFFTTKDPGKGSGLGLATVYGVVKQCEGQISVYSQPGTGTIFEIYLPVARQTVEARPRSPSPKGSETVLVVDDEEGVRKVVSAVLRSNGYEVLEAGNGISALASYEKNGHKIDIVLADVVMPQMDGLVLGQELNLRAPGVKILYMSGYRDIALNGAGADPAKPFLHKPFTPDALLSKVREVLDAEPA